jgi:ribulose-5-phosphate 4-epimerase/fuculose-1-phosphate aldolase
MFKYVILSSGVILDPGSTTFGVDALGFSLYASIYNSRPDINCLIHIRTPPVSAVSSMKCGLLPICQEACICGPSTTQTIKIDAATNRLSIDENIRNSNAKVSENLKYME